jgi:MFS family permease
MLFGSLFLSFVLVLVGFAANFWELIVALLFFGSARNLMTLSINTQGVAIQALYKKSIMANFHGIWSLAGFAGAAVGLLMVVFNVQPRWHFIGVSVLLVAATLYFIESTIHQPPIRAAKKSFKWPERIYLKAFLAILTGAAIYIMIRLHVPPLHTYAFVGVIFLSAMAWYIASRPDKQLLKFSLICFACMACENTMYDWGALYFQKEVNPDKTLATAAFVIFMVAVTTGRFFGDRIVNQIGIKKVLRFSGIFIFCGLAVAVGLPYAVTASLGYILIGVGVSCVVPMVFSLAGKSTNMSSSSALASISTVGYMGFIIIPPFVGYVAKAASLRLSFGIVTFFGLLIVYLVSKIRDDHTENPSAESENNSMIDAALE